MCRRKISTHLSASVASGEVVRDRNQSVSNGKKEESIVRFCECRFDDHATSRLQNQTKGTRASSYLFVHRGTGLFLAKQRLAEDVVTLLRKYLAQKAYKYGDDVLGRQNLPAGYVCRRVITKS